MYDYVFKKLPQATCEALIKIPQTIIKAEYDKSFSKLQKDLKFEGFRTGKVPKTIAEKNIKKEDVYQDLIKQLLPNIYEEIVKKENIQPIINPKIELTKAKEGEDWEIKIMIAVKPSVELKDYKSAVKQVKAKFKKDAIWVPGKDQEKKTDSEIDKQKILNEILNSLIKETKVEISELIIEEELNRRLSQQLDEIQKIGLTVDSYLKSKNITLDQFKSKYRQEINDTYKLEFILQAVADQEGIKVEKDDLNQLFGKIKDEKERKAAEANAYFYAAILRKQKTLDFLYSL